MKELTLILTFLGCLIPLNEGFASNKEWEHSDVQTSKVKMNPLQFNNRAQCALQSEHPAASAFVFINNMDVARGIYRLALATGEDRSEFTRMGVNAFRRSVYELLSFIHQKLSEGSLPLLPADMSEKGSREFKSSMENCRQDEACPTLNDYIEVQWQKMENGVKIEKAKQLKPKEDLKLSCHYLKKFSTFQAHTFGVKPTKKSLEKMAEMALKKDELVSRCQDLQAQENLKVSTYQIDLLGVDQSSQWKKQGFDYWNSLKLYFSWAWRFAHQMEEMAFPFSKVFRSVDIEDAVMLVPNGCRSLTKPKCNGDFLSLQTMREFASENFSERAAELDVLRDVPDGADSSLLSDRFPNVNTDILDFASQDDADSWLESFRDNLSGTRLIMKRKLRKSLNYFNLVLENISPKEVTRKIRKDLIGKDLSPHQKQELYNLCTEFNVAHHEDFSFLRKDLSILSKTDLIENMSADLFRHSTQKAYDFYKTLGDEILSICKNEYNPDRVFDESFEHKKEGLMPWYIDKYVQDKKIESEYKKILKNHLKNSSPLLAYEQYAKTKSLQDVVCAHSSHCARQTLSHLIDLYSVAQYSETFFNLNQKIKSPSLLNPYAERTACKVYDPWYKTKSMLVGVMSDLGQAALSATTAGFIYSRFDLKPEKVTSFNELIKDGKIQFHPNMHPERVRSSLNVNFGPLLDVPCEVSISSPNGPTSYYTFTGINVQACGENEDNNLSVRSASDTTQHEPTGSSGCLSCSISFESAVQTISLFQPASSFYYLFRASYRLFSGMKDPHNIPRSWKVNINHVTDTYKKFGEIPHQCVKKLSSNGPCLLNACDNKVAEHVEKHFEGGLQKISYRGNRVKVKLSTCDSPLYGKFLSRQLRSNLRTYEGHKCYLTEDLKVPDQCQSKENLSL